MLLIAVVVLVSVALVTVDCVLLWLVLTDVPLLVAVEVSVTLKLLPVELVCVLLLLSVALVLSVLVLDTVRVVSVDVLLILKEL